jgi:tripartite-type tricarboxylate transporter receptor subunit TctC
MYKKLVDLGDINMTNRREFNKTVAAAGAIGAFGFAGYQSPAIAQAIDNLKIICGFPAGGTSDAVSRRVADKARGDIAKASVVENKTGAGGRIAVEAVKASAPDGQTLLLTPHSIMSIYPYIYNKLSYDPLNDFVPVSMGASFSLALAVGPMVPDSVKNVKDFVAWCKANPSKAAYGSPAAGSTPHFAGAILEKTTGVELRHVAYRGSVPGVADVIGGQIASMFTPVGDFLQMAKAGKLRILATTETKRTRFTPDVQTFTEAGFPQINWNEWFAFWAPAKTPANIIASTSASIQKALAMPDVVDALGNFGLVAEGSSGADLGRALKVESDRWGPLVKQIGFTAES